MCRARTPECLCGVFPLARHVIVDWCPPTSFAWTADTFKKNLTTSAIQKTTNVADSGGVRSKLLDLYLNRVLNAIPPLPDLAPEEPTAADAGAGAATATDAATEDAAASGDATPTSTAGAGTTTTAASKPTGPSSSRRGRGAAAAVVVEAPVAPTGPPKPKPVWTRNAQSEDAFSLLFGPDGERLSTRGVPDATFNRCPAEFKTCTSLKYLEATTVGGMLRQVCVCYVCYVCCVCCVLCFFDLCICVLLLLCVLCCVLLCVFVCVLCCSHRLRDFSPRRGS